MALHPEFPLSPYETLDPDHRWFPAAEELRGTAYEKLLPPLVANIRKEVFEWRASDYRGASPTSKALLKWWFETEHLTEQADGTLLPFRYYFAQREAVETVIWLHDVRHVKDKFDLMRFDASGAVSVRHVRGGVAALCSQDGHRRRQNQGSLTPHRLELLPQAL